MVAGLTPVVRALKEPHLHLIRNTDHHLGLLRVREESHALEDFPAGRSRTRHFTEERSFNPNLDLTMHEATEIALAALLEVSGRTGRPLMELALAFVRSRPFVDSILLGARTERQLAEIVAWNETSLSEEETQMLLSASENLLCISA